MIGGVTHANVPSAGEERPVVAVLATDGSDAALHAMVRGMAVIRRGARPVLATVAPDADPSLVTGTGFAGGVMSVAEKDELLAAQDRSARQLLAEAAEAIGVPSAERVVLRGDAGVALCELAAERRADVIVLGTRGLGGIKRAVLGSVSDHVARHAPCAVLTIGVDAS